MRVLCDPFIRSNAGVKKNNLYVFPSLPQSVNHCSVRRSLDSVCQKLPFLKHKINPTKIRRRIGYLKTGMDIKNRLFKGWKGQKPLSNCLLLLIAVASSKVFTRWHNISSSNSYWERPAPWYLLTIKVIFLRKSYFLISFLFFLTWRVWRVFKVLAFAFMPHSRDSDVSIFQGTTYGEYLQVAHFYTQISVDN